MNFELGCLASDLGFPGLLRALEKSDVGMIPATKSLELRMANAKITICHRRGALSRFSSSGNHDMNITRRDFLTASAGFAAVPLLGARGVAAPLPREADIVVIGAGAAGIAAARRVIAANRKVIVIEAAGEIGGRCLTDTTTFDVPLDRGARWLHNPDANPLIKLARALALEMVVAPVGQKIRIGRRNARPGETEEFLAALVRTNRAIEEASRGKLDMACGSVIDKVRGGDRGALIACRLGLGTMVAKLADQIPVALSTPANRVEWSNRDVTVQTPAGKIAARAAVVTVSTNVLASGAIRFDPDLPKRKLDAASKLSLGSFDHITLQLSGNPLGLARDDAIIEQSSSTKTALLLANIGGSSVCSVDVGGSFGRDLSSQGEKAMVAFAVEWLTKLFGSEVGAAVKKSAATRWNAAPFVLGAMSAASPGGEPSRAALAEPMGAVFLAGEAAHETLWGTVDGAWESGERAADAALRKIGALKDTTPAAPVPPGRSHRRSTSSRSARY
jgi:monoamine oxidase